MSAQSLATSANQTFKALFKSTDDQMFFRHKIKLAVFFFPLIIFAVFIVVNQHKGGLIVSGESSSKLTVANLLSSQPALSVEGRAPELRGIADWLNSGPLSWQDLKGKVVLVDFWTYSCINCIRTLPHLSEWHQKYKDNGFVILGIHAPEFKFEKKKENVEEAVKKYNIKYPVALDNAYETWNAFANQYWPAHYLIDAKGNIRYHSFGEGHYIETETAIQSLLLEDDLLTLDKITEIKEPSSATDFQSIGTPEIYLGYLRINNAGNIDSDTKPDLPHVFTAPTSIQENKFYFTGTWTIGPEAAELVKGKGKLILRYKANKVNIVAETKDGKEIPLEIFLDGKSRRTVPISSPQLYNLIDTTGDGDWHTLEIRITVPGFHVFTFTFG